MWSVPLGVGKTAAGKAGHERREAASGQVRNSDNHSHSHKNGPGHQADNLFCNTPSSISQYPNDPNAVTYYLIVPSVKGIILYILIITYLAFSHSLIKSILNHF